MNRKNLLVEVDECGKALTEAQISLRIALQQAYPVGLEVVAKLGARNIIISVTGHGTPSAPGDIRGTNVATGKPRKFHYSAIVCVVGEY